MATGNIAAPSLQSSQRLLRAWLRAKRKGNASGFANPMIAIEPVPQPRPKAKRRALVWNGEPQITLTLHQRVLLDRVKRTRVPCRDCGGVAEIYERTERWIDEHGEDQALTIVSVWCDECLTDCELGTRPYDEDALWAQMQAQREAFQLARDKHLASLA